jgi:hypothetical protein
MVKEVLYEVVLKAGDLEIRRYPSMMIARVTGMSDNDAFSVLFNYIQGSNRSKKKVPMTAPVISSERIAMTAPVISGGGSFSFVMPEEYGPRDVPAPTDKRIRIEKMRGRTVAVLRFSGGTSGKKVGRRFDELSESVWRNGMRPMGSPFLMRYNSPFVPWPFRRNEVAVEIMK